jgi:hypothetical protein
MRTLCVFGLVLLLGGFTPPQRQSDLPDRTQLVLPKSWIPDRKPDTDPPIIVPGPPAAEEPEAPPSPPGFTSEASRCVLERGDFSPEFRDAVDAAQAEHEAGDNEEALRLVETASGLATSDLQRYLVDMLRVQVFKSMRNREGNEAALRSLIARDCFIVPGEREIWQQYLDELTGRTTL